MSTVHSAAADAIVARQRALAEETCANQYGRQNGVWELYGEVGRRRCSQDAEYLLGFLSEALRVQHLSLFTQYVAWSKVRSHGLHLPEDTLQMSLECTMDTLRAKLPLELSAAAGEYIKATIRHLPDFPVSQPSFVEVGRPMGEFAARYLSALLNGDRHEARRVIVDAAGQGVKVRKLYEQVLEPALKEIGRLWQAGEVTVAQEHFSTASTQWIMSQLYPQLFGTSRKGRRLVAACVGGELHELGARMVADLFELDGWDAYYLGANSPTHSIVQAVVRWKADILALSTTMVFHLSEVRDTIAAVRAEHGVAVKILVGGYTFTLVPELWKEVGADGSAISASDAVKIGTRLTDTRP